MLRFLRGPILGIIATLLWVLNTIFWTFFFFIIAICKLIVPNQVWRQGCTALLDDLASHWMSVNNFLINLFIGVKWEVAGDVTGIWLLPTINHGRIL